MKEPSKAKSAKSKEADFISYSDAVAELESILEGIESGETDIDLLSEQLKRAVFLVRLCRSKLRNTDQEVKKIIKEFDQEEE
ncbi:MAG TPA: exodeoxyribonuclease VII small subunit [Bacteroidia bacterium]|nr:exodeoxyribonuclease VII small subunit [Bacteroidia bacterium]